MKNPFNYNRVNGDWTDEEIRLKFVKPRQCADFEEQGHRVLLGSAASGKTHILRYLSLPVRLKENSDTPPYIGVYISFTDSMVNPFKDAYRESGEWTLFGHYFNLAIAERTAWTIQQLQLGMETEERLVEEAAKVFRFTGNPRTLESLRRDHLGGAQNDVCHFVNET